MYVCGHAIMTDHPPSIDEGITEPGVELEGPGVDAGGSGCGPEVVGGAAGANDEDALVQPEWSQGPADVVVVGGVEVGLDRELADRYVGVGVHEPEGHPSTMVKPPGVVLLHPLHPSLLQQLLHPFC